MFAKKTRNMKLSLNMPCIGNELNNAIHEDELGKIRNSYINSNVIQNSRINVNKHRHSQKLHHNCHPYNHVNINRNFDIHNGSNSNKEDSAFNNDHGFIKDN